MSSSLTVSAFINTKYREFWEYSNMNGKNSIDAREQIPEVVRKIIYAAYRLKIREKMEHKTTELMGEVGKFHPHGPSSIEDSIKGVATAYKSQIPVRILEGVGNFGSAPGDEGAAGRYTSISGTPLLSAIYQDIPFVPFNTDDTGLSQPEYISSPLPFALINGASPIGTGKSCYIAERDAQEVIHWLDALRQNDWDPSIVPPDAMSVTGCNTWFEPSNGYVYYEAVVHYGVDMDDLNKRGKYDVITALPPKSTTQNVIYKLNNKLPTRVTKSIVDGSGLGRNTYIIVPKGYLDPKDFFKYGMKSAREEQIYVWDHNARTMRFSTLVDVAKEWFNDRSQVVGKRIQSQMDDLALTIKKIDLIKLYAENDMTKWKESDIISFFKNLDAEQGENDAHLVNSLPVRTFLPENLEKNALMKQKTEKDIKELKRKLNHLGDVVIEEAQDVIQKQINFFKS